MNPSRENLAERRRQLSIEIARQRSELASAYQGLAKPIEYTQTGIKGFKFLKQNAWLIALSPSLVSLLFNFFGLKKTSRAGRRDEEREARREAERAKRPLMRWVGHGVSLFKFYRKIRSFIP